MTVRHDVNAKFYGQACNAPDLLLQAGPKAAEPLYASLQQAMQTEIQQGAFRPSEIFSPSQNRTTADASWKGNSGSSSNNVQPGIPVTMGSMHTGPASLADAATPSPAMARET